MQLGGLKIGDYDLKNVHFKKKKKVNTKCPDKKENEKVLSRSREVKFRIVLINRSPSEQLKFKLRRIESNKRVRIGNILSYATHL